jgi:hypothetical protein
VGHHQQLVLGLVVERCRPDGKRVFIVDLIKQRPLYIELMEDGAPTRITRFVRAGSAGELSSRDYDFSDTPKPRSGSTSRRVCARQENTSLAFLIGRNARFRSLASGKPVRNATTTFCESRMRFETINRL